MKNRLSQMMLLSCVMIIICSCGHGRKNRGMESPTILTRPIWKFDFGTAEQEKGYNAVDNMTPYSGDRGYGWVTFPQNVRDRGAPDALRRDFVFSATPALFRIDVEPGIYKLACIMGDMEYEDHFLTISLPGINRTLPVLNTQKGEFATLTVGFENQDRILEILMDSPGGNWILNALTLEPCSLAEEPKITKERFEVKRQIKDTWEDVFSWDNPIMPHWDRFREHLSKKPGFQPTGLTRKDYLKVIEGDVDYFRNFQDEQGAIIDPFKKIEWQYSTPCFALAAATLVVHAGRTDLLEPAAKAMDWASMTLSQRKAATAHEDFFPPQIAHALPLLKPLVSQERYNIWIDHIRSFDPYATYRAGTGGGNWNVVALSGEGLFYQMGLRENKDYIEDCLSAQGKFFNSPWGLYTEGPMAYDHFPRIWTADMLASGFQGKNTDKLSEILDRGALTSLFMQSPTGELPTGGRSAHHQWNEAEQCVTYEIYSAKAKQKGDERTAGVYKRAAHLALGSIRRWIRPSGELWIVKNRVDPSQNHGYEGYSAHSQYNLLAMAMLSIAYQHAGDTEDIEEQATPADVGGFVIILPQPHHKIFANAGGLYLEIDYAADLHYNPTGLLRIHKMGMNPQLGPSDGLLEKPSSRYPEGPRTTAAIGVSWKDKTGAWRRLAEFGSAPKTRFGIGEERPDKAIFHIVYEHEFDGPSRIIETYTLTPEWIDMTATLMDYSGPMRFVLPVLSDDGERKTEIKTSDSKITVALDDDVQSYHAIGAESVWVEEQKYPFRNGWAQLAFAEYPSAQKAVLRIMPTGK